MSGCDEKAHNYKQTQKRIDRNSRGPQVPNKNFNDTYQCDFQM